MVDRDLEPLIATQFLTAHPLGPQVDIAFGGGRCFFLPNSTEGSCRPDDKDLFEDAKKDMNLKVITSAAELASVEEGKKGLGTVGLFNLDVGTDALSLALADSSPFGIYSIWTMK